MKTVVNLGISHLDLNMSIELIKMSCSYIEILDLNYTQIPARHFKNILQLCTFLRELNLSSTADDYHLDLISELCPNITRIIIPFCKALHDCNIINLIKSCHKIELLNIAKTTATDDSAIAALTMLKNLQTLHLSNCNITAKILDYIADDSVHNDF